MTGLDYNHAHYHFLRMSEMGKVFWAHTFGFIASGLVTIFIPIYLYQLGYPLDQVFLYLTAQFFYAFLLQYHCAKVVAKLGGNKSMVLGIFFHIVFFLALLTLPSAHWPLLLLPVPWAFTRSLYWVAFHANFSKSRSHAKAGSQVGIVQAIAVFAHGATPAIGGVLASEIGIAWVYGVSIGLFAVAAVPLLFGAEVTKHRPLKMRLLNWRKIRPDLVATFAYGVSNAIEMTIWPLLVFFVVSSYAGVGLLSSVVTLAAILVSIYVGRHEAARGERHYLKEGVTLTGATHLLRLAGQTGGGIFGINLLSGIGHSLTSTPFLSRYYELADEEPRLEYITAWEAAHDLGWVLIFGTIWLLLIALPTSVPDSAIMLAGVVMAVPTTLAIRKLR